MREERKRRKRKRRSGSSRGPNKPIVDMKR